MTFRPRDPPKVAQVLEFLTGADDFCTTEQVVTGTRMTKQQAQCSLHSLYHYKAVDCMKSEGQLFWYATPDTDNRIAHRRTMADRRVKPGYKRSSTKRRNWTREGPPPRNRQ